MFSIATSHLRPDPDFLIANHVASVRGVIPKIRRSSAGRGIWRGADQTLTHSTRDPSLRLNDGFGQNDCQSSKPIKAQTAPRHEAEAPPDGVPALAI